MINLPDFIFKDIPEINIRENFKRLNNFLQKNALLKSEWTFFELTFASAVTNSKVQHGLGYRPLDVIQTSITGAGVITFNYSLFNETTIDITTTDACTVRCFIGAYREESNRGGR